MVIHIFKDGSTTDNLEGKIIKVEGNEQMYKKLEQCLLQDRESKGEK